MAKTRSKAAYMISAVAEQYQVHPQTLRLYEREGLLKPSRSEGNTRLYTDEDLERLEVILQLTRELGVNLAGVEIILNMREKMVAMQQADRGVRGHPEPRNGGSSQTVRNSQRDLLDSLSCAPPPPPPQKPARKKSSQLKQRTGRSPPAIGPSTASSPYTSPGSRVHQDEKLLVLTDSPQITRQAGPWCRRRPLQHEGDRHVGILLRVVRAVLQGDLVGFVGIDLHRARRKGLVLPARPAIALLEPREDILVQVPPGLHHGVSVDSDAAPAQATRRWPPKRRLCRARSLLPKRKAPQLQRLRIRRPTAGHAVHLVERRLPRDRLRRCSRFALLHCRGWGCLTASGK